MPPVARLLVANRGEIACRVLRTARAMGIATVAVFTEPDAQAVHVAEADEAVPLGPPARYLDPAALVEAALRSGADAVHPGYGFLSERADFARACAAANLTFVGPAAEVIASMGDKLAAKERMAETGVPVLPTYEIGDVPPGAWPVIVKAAAGGGGRGMRVVEDPDALPDAVAAARREAAAAFGDDRLFAEPYLRDARHVEVQILGDQHGCVVALGERECSIQRRHQKVVEESPSPAVDEALRERLCAAALAAAKALEYTSAGTVEFVLDVEGFAFLELNTRLQVEHPVTEAAWGIRGAGPLDLVREQLRIARGEPLGYGQDEVECRGHAVEARLYAEDPRSHLPSTGTVEVWRPPTGPGVRVDAGIREGSQIGVDYDPLLAKIIGAGPTRPAALDVLARALEETWVGGVATNRDLLAAVVRSPAFRAGSVTTSFLQDQREALEAALIPSRERRWWHAAAAALAAAARRRRDAAVLATLPSGWRNNPSQPQRISYRTAEVAYALRRDGKWAVTIDDAERVVHVRGVTGEVIDLEIDGRRRRVSVVEVGNRAHVRSALGADTLTALPRLPPPTAQEPPGSLLAPMPGTVRQVAVRTGDVVERGDLLVVLEAMKMEHRVTAAAAGRVAEVRVAPGRAVAAGDVLVVMDVAGSG